MFVRKTIKYGLLTLAGTAAVGTLLFGRDATSYVSTTYNQIRGCVKSNVPIEFELQRARDMVNDIIPEMQSNIHLIAQQEVEIDRLKDDIAISEKSLADERTRIASLRDVLGSDAKLTSLGGIKYSREEIRDDLGRRFESVKEAEMVLSGKRRLMDNREKSLQVAIQTLAKVRGQKAQLEAQIVALQGQYQLVKAASAGSSLSIDHSKLAKSQQLITEIKEQLDVAERVLAHEAKFVNPISVDVVNEKDLLSQVDGYLGSEKRVATK